MMPGLLDSSIPQWKLNYHICACLELFNALGRLEPTFIEAHQASKMICKVRSLKSRMKTPSFFEDIRTLRKEVLSDFEFDTAVDIMKLGNPTREIAKNHDILKKNPGS
jgi:hypothetical protein